MSEKSSSRDLLRIALAKQKEKRKNPSIPEDYLDKKVRQALSEGRINDDGDIYPKE